MDEKTKKDVNSILSIIGYNESDADHYFKKTAQILNVDLENASTDDIQAILQTLMVDYGKKRLGFSTEFGEEPLYILIAIKEIVPELDYQDLNIQYYLDGNKVDHNSIDIDSDFEIVVKFSFNGGNFSHKYYGHNYIDELVNDINREFLIPMFSLRFYSFLNTTEVSIYGLFPSSLTPEEFIKFSDYL